MLLLLLLTIMIILMMTYHCILPAVCYRQYAAAQQDLLEALRLSPNNRELRRLLMHVKEECKEQARYDGGGQLLIGEMDRISEDEDDTISVTDRHPEETAL